MRQTTDRDVVGRNQVTTALRKCDFDLMAALSPVNYEAAKEKFFQATTVTDDDTLSPEFIYGTTEFKLPSVAELRELPSLSETEQELVREIGNTAVLKMTLYDELMSRQPRDFDMLLIRDLNRQLYGNIDTRVYRYLLWRELAELEEKEYPKAVKEFLPLIERLKELVRKVTSERDPEEIIYRPKPKTVQKFKALVEEEFRMILRRIPEHHAEEWTAEEVAELVNGYLEIWGTDFRAVVDSRVHVINNDMRQRKLILPEKRSLGPYTTEVVKAVICGHEMTHILRSVRHENNDTLLSLPLPGYEAFEEGVAKCVEAVLGGGDYDPRVGVDHYLTVGLALVDHLPFGKVFGVQWSLQFLRSVEASDTRELLEQKLRLAKNRAFRNATRAFRGSMVAPLTKDLMYFNGYNQAWRLIEAGIGSPVSLSSILFRSGKIDPLNPLHQKLLQSYGGPFNSLVCWLRNYGMV